MMQMRVSYMISGVALAIGAASITTDDWAYAIVFLIVSLLYYANGVICEKRGK